MAAPSLDQFLEAARPSNPGVSDADLSAYWKTNYGGDTAVPVAAPVAPSGPSLESFLKKAKPENPGASDADLEAYWEQTYPGAPKKNESDFKRGAEVAFGQTVPLAKGAVGLIGATIEKATGEGGVATKVKEWGLHGFQEGMQKLAPKQRENDDITVAWDKAKNGDIGALADWAAYAMGYGLGQLGETIGVAALGAVAASVAGPDGPVAGA